MWEWILIKPIYKKQVPSSICFIIINDIFKYYLSLYHKNSEFFNKITIIFIIIHKIAKILEINKWQQKSKFILTLVAIYIGLLFISV